MPKVKGARRFIVFCHPHMADPSWVTPIVEFEDREDGQQAAPIEYQDADELERVVRKVQLDRARASGYNAGAKNVLDTFELKIEDYYKRVKENKEKADLAKVKNGV